MTRAVLVLLLCAASTASAQNANPANDWLVAFPLCAMGDDAFQGGETAVLYPRPGLAALLHGGETLVTRVRLATPLTPPPGHQQEKALRGWSVELLGRAGRITRSNVEHRYTLRVSDVRPDSRAGLVYRASIPIPPWVAPGTYDVRLKAPGTREHMVAVASLRVLRPGAEPRVQRLPNDATREQLSRISDAPVDVWFSEGTEALRSPLQGQGVPWVDLTVQGVVFRTQSHAYSVGSCDDPLTRFEDLRRVGFLNRELLPVPDVPITISTSVLQPGTTFERAESLIVFAEGSEALSVEGAEHVSFWPGTPPTRAGHRASVVALIVGGGDVEIEPVAPQAFDPTVQVPDVVVAGDAFEVSAQGDGPMGVAWSWEEDGASFSYGPSEPLPLTLRQMRRQVLRLWAVDAQGNVARKSVVLLVETDRPAASCSMGTPIPRGFAWIFGALLALWYGSRRVISLSPEE
ncbi:MAG: hypothetical protein AB8H86_09305 [Polyangiales bacterium]